MSLDGLNSEILGDFVTESRELIEATDQDLVLLEQRPDDQELINAIFRAMHTIKGASSFLSLDPITELAHAAEDALNSLRQSASSVTGDTMDLILQAVDLLRNRIESVDSGEMPETAPEELLTALRRLGSGESQREAVRDVAPEDSTPTAATSGEAETAAPAASAEPGKLELPEAKTDILEFVVEDMSELLDQLAGLLETAREGDVAATSTQLADITEQLRRCVDFFGVKTLITETTAMHDAAVALHDLAAEATPQVLTRMAALVEVTRRRGTALGELQLIPLNTDTLVERLLLAVKGELTDESMHVDEHADVEAVLAFDDVDDAPTATEEAAVPEVTTEAAPAATEAAPTAPPAAGAPADTKPKAGNEPARAPAADRTIRVDVDRLETLLNLVGELVLQKNRVLGMGKRFVGGQFNARLAEELMQIGGDLDQITSDLQISVMKTRMQPLSKLFNRYPRVIRDLSRSLGKNIELKMVGGDTEVDKSVIESLGDPLVHILRNSADHGVEMPDVRTEAGKNAVGTIELGARHEGNNVLVTIRDDGKGLDGEKIAKKAVEKGLITQEAAQQMSDVDMQNLVFMAGFSTAEQLSDVSGRGVGMDVVRTNITKLNGTVDLRSKKGEGTTVSIRIPLTVAIMPALMVNIREEMYAVAISNIQEIVRPEADSINQVAGKPVLRLRDSVLPLVDMGSLFDGPSIDGKLPPIAVIVALGEKRLGMLVDGLVGQEEIVIKPLDDDCDRTQAICGATVREDGAVSLIIDIAELFKSLDQSMRNAA